MNATALEPVRVGEMRAMLKRKHLQGYDQKIPHVRTAVRT